jgi:hypothetical protein
MAVVLCLILIGSISLLQVVYYDTDFIFGKSPVECADACPSTAELCSSKDGEWVNGVRGGSYFNAGFMVMKPSALTAQNLIKNFQRAARREFAEQDYVNDFFKNKWHDLGHKCDFMGNWAGDNIKKAFQGLSSTDAQTRAASPVAFHQKTRDVDPEWLHKNLRDVIEWSAQELSKFANPKQTAPARGTSSESLSFGMTHTGIVRAKRDCFDMLGCKQSGPCAQCPTHESKCCRKAWKLDPLAVDDPTRGEGCEIDEGCEDAHCCVGDLKITPVKVVDLDAVHQRLANRSQQRHLAFNHNQQHLASQEPAS